MNECRPVDGLDFAVFDIDKWTQQAVVLNLLLIAKSVRGFIAVRRAIPGATVAPNSCDQALPSTRKVVGFRVGVQPAADLRQSKDGVGCAARPRGKSTQTEVSTKCIRPPNHDPHAVVCNHRLRR